MKDQKIPPIYTDYRENPPQPGDLVYCHCVGSKYGWYLDQIGIIAKEKVAHRVSKTSKRPILQSEVVMAELFAKIYNIYLTKLNKTIEVDYHAFETGEVEVITNFTQEEMDDLNARKVNLSKYVDLDNRR